MRLNRKIDAAEMALAREDQQLAQEIWALKRKYSRRADLLHTMGHTIQAMSAEHWNNAVRGVDIETPKPDDRLFHMSTAGVRPC